jgi:hypothetical protein
MASLQAHEMRFLADVLGMEEGYVLDFTDRTFAEFFALELKINIEDPRFQNYGTSKAKRLRAFLQQAEDLQAARALRGLWLYREALERAEDPARAADTRCRYQEIVDRLTGSGPSLAGAIERFADNATLDELVAAIERDLGAGKPHVALDRLHTYCMKKFGHLLVQRGESISDKDTLNGRAGRYLNPLRREAKAHPITDRILRNTVETFELLNGVRNNASLAHDNELMAVAEAQFVFDSVIALLRFIRVAETSSEGLD